MAGRAKHLAASKACNNWWTASLRNHTHQIKPKSSISSEIDSDELEESSCLRGDCAEDAPTEDDQDLLVPEDPLVWAGDCGEENETPGFESNANFTSSPSGIDLHLEELTTTPETSIFIEEYLGAADVIEMNKDLFSQMWEADEYHECRKIGGPHYPFSGPMEWEVVEWLHSLQVPMDRIDRFFDLEYVSCCQYTFTCS